MLINNRINLCQFRQVCLFFFQAEDGIRDGTVTGVQTCALPILKRIWVVAGIIVTALIVAATAGPTSGLAADGTVKVGVIEMLTGGSAFYGNAVLERSEERRVGKECSATWWLASGEETRAERAGA